MKRYSSFAAGALALFVLAACSDDRTTGPAGQAAFTRFVAMGTSLTMGVQSDGVVYFTQQEDWTNLLAHQAMARYTQPLIAPPGCFSSGARYDGNFSMSLEEAQRAKHKFIADSLHIKEGSKVLDMACGALFPIISLRKEARAASASPCQRAKRPPAGRTAWR